MPDRVRFSPAPSGELHLGGARTALFNYLLARSGGGTFVVRIEDTDAARSDLSRERGLLGDLAWLGLSWNEGPDVGGPFGPYRQSERTAHYAEALGRLEAAGRVYRCFCAAATLEAGRHTDGDGRRPPRYRGGCRSIDSAESRRRAEAGEPFAWRFAVDPEREWVVRDVIHGDVRFAGSDIGDFLVARPDATPLYDLACAVDDAAMRITLVIRGDDHLSNTPRHLMLLEALGATAPNYAHAPLVLGADGRPLSKSRGAESIASLREQGYLPAAVVNHLALLGWSDPAGREVLGTDELAEAFDLARVSSSAPAHDPARLRWLNKRHMALLPREDRVALVAEHAPDLPGAGSRAVAEALADEVEVAGDVRGLVSGVAEPLAPDEEALAALAAPGALRALEVAVEALSAPEIGDLRDALRSAGLPLREAFPAVRAALTGRAHGLPAATLLTFLGNAETVRRLERALRA
jgi:glutamyl-tRNA synthetase